MITTNTIKYTLISVMCGVLSSCGIQIQFENAVPAEVNLGRGMSVLVRDNTHSHRPLDQAAARELCRAFRHQMAEDCYYVPVDWAGAAGARIELSGTHVRRSGEGKNTSSYLCTTVDVESGYRNYYRSHEETFMYEDCQGRHDLYAAARKIARRTMVKLTPHFSTYSEYVDENEQNPALGQGARACAAGNWEQGRRLAQQALAVNPNEAEAYYLLGLIERHAQNFVASDEMFRKAASLGDKSKYAKGIRGNADIQRNAEVFRQQMSYR